MFEFVTVHCLLPVLAELLGELANLGLIWIVVLGSGTSIRTTGGKFKFSQSATKLSALRRAPSLILEVSWGHLVLSAREDVAIRP